MTQHYNKYQQPVGFPLENWTACPYPQHLILEGDYCHLEPVNADKHTDALFAAYQLAEDDRDWTYLFAERPANKEACYQYLKKLEQSRDPLHFTIVDGHTEQPVGTISLMRIDPQHGVIEVGNVVFSPLLKQTIMSTEVHFLLMQYAMEQLGYRRYEWKCDSLNAPSRKAADRLGFTFEGIFRQAIVYKNRSRDTAWFSILDSEWPKMKYTFQNWLSSENFDEKGKQKRKLQEIRAEFSQITNHN